MDRMRWHGLVPGIWIGILFLPAPCKAQVFGGNPPSLKWEQINTDTARVIFPVGLESEGERVASLVHYMNLHERKSIGTQEWKINIVLQNQTTLSNGYVEVAPFRSEFQITPSQQVFSLGSENWVDFLSVHEYRHALQNMNFRQGISALVYHLFGQEGFALVTNAAVPNWYWEGDAVFMETALTGQGRGRLPSFLDDFRAYMVSHTHYSFLKIRNGSLKDLVPDHYPLGYMLVAYGREMYGNDFWEKVTSDAVRYRGLFYPLSRSLKRRTGENIYEFYQSAIGFYQNHWKAEDSGFQTRSLPITPADPRTVTDYQFPRFLDSERILVVRSSYKRIPAFVVIGLHGGQQVLTRQTIVNDNYFSSRDSKIAWVEYRTDPRWGWKDYGVLKIYDFRSGTTRTLSHQTKYFSPDIAPDDSRIVVFECTPDLKFALKILDLNTGQVLATLPNPDQFYYTYPKFTADGKALICAVKNSQGEMALIRQETGDGKITILVPFSHKVLGIPEISGSHIYFSASFGNVDNIYEVGAGGGVVYQVTGEPNGCYQPAVSPDGKTLVFSYYTFRGRQLRRMDLDSTRFREVSPETIRGTNDLFVGKALRQEGADILDRVGPRDFPVTRYPQTAGLVNFHSIQPAFQDPNYGLDLVSNNILNTFDLVAGYNYNRNEQSSGISFSGIYAGLYPLISAGAGYTFNRNLVTSHGDRVFWNERTVNGGLSIPLNFISGKYFYGLTGGSSLYSSMVHYRPNPKYMLRDFSVDYFNTSIGFTHQLVQANQNIFSHFAQTLFFQYERTLGLPYAEQGYGIGDFYFPGLFVNHSVVLEGEFQHRDNQHAYEFPDNFIYSRGYDPGTYSDIYRLAANYTFPLVYPDFGFAGIVYFLRLRANLFYDYSRSRTLHAQGYFPDYYRSAGAELFFDTKWWNEYPLTFGIRYSRLFDADPLDPSRTHLVELVLPLQLF